VKKTHNSRKYCDSKSAWSSLFPISFVRLNRSKQIACLSACLVYLFSGNLVNASSTEAQAIEVAQYKGSPAHQRHRKTLLEQRKEELQKRLTERLRKQEAEHQARMKPKKDQNDQKQNAPLPLLENQELPYYGDHPEIQYRYQQARPTREDEMFERPGYLPPSPLIRPRPGTSPGDSETVETYIAPDVDMDGYSPPAYHVVTPEYVKAAPTDETTPVYEETETFKKQRQYIPEEYQPSLEYAPLEPDYTKIPVQKNASQASSEQDSKDGLGVISPPKEKRYILGPKNYQKTEDTVDELPWQKQVEEDASEGSTEKKPDDANVKAADVNAKDVHKTATSAVEPELEETKSDSSSDKEAVRLYTPDPQAPFGEPVESEALDVSKEGGIVAMQDKQEQLSKETREILASLPNNLDTIEPPAVLESKHEFDISRQSPDIDVPEATSTTANESVGADVNVRSLSFDTGYELEKAYNALIAGNTEEAVRIYNDILTMEPDNSVALFGLATTYHRIGLLDQARTAYGRLLKIDPYNREALNNFLALVGEEAPLAAIERLKALYEENKDFSPIAAQIALLYRKTGNYTMGIEYMQKALAISPENLAYRYNLAVLYDLAGKRQQAITLYRRLLDASMRGQALPAPASAIQERLTFLASN
jgi:tetratricopeptide (TPR) repeat protein